MKTHLPVALRKSLLAALVAVSFAVYSKASAVDVVITGHNQKEESAGDMNVTGTIPTGGYDGLELIAGNDASGNAGNINVDASMTPLFNAYITATGDIEFGSTDSRYADLHMGGYKTKPQTSSTYIHADGNIIMHGRVHAVVGQKSTAGDGAPPDMDMTGTMCITAGGDITINAMGGNGSDSSIKVQFGGGKDRENNTVVHADGDINVSCGASGELAWSMYTEVYAGGDIQVDALFWNSLFSGEVKTEGQFGVDGYNVAILPEDINSPKPEVVSGTGISVNSKVSNTVSYSRLIAQTGNITLNSHGTGYSNYFVSGYLHANAGNVEVQGNQGRTWVTGTQILSDTSDVSMKGKKVEAIQTTFQAADEVMIAGTENTGLSDVTAKGNRIQIGSETGYTNIGTSSELVDTFSLVEATDSIEVIGSKVNISDETKVHSDDGTVNIRATGVYDAATQEGTVNIREADVAAEDQVSIDGSLVNIVDTAIESDDGGVSITGSDVSVSGENVTGAGIVDIAGNSTTSLRGVDVDGAGVAIGKSDAAGQTKVEDSTIDSTDTVAVAGESVEVSGKNVTGAGAVDIAGNSTTTVSGVDVDGAGVTIGKSDATGLTKVEDSTIDSTDIIAIAGADVSVSGKNVTGAGAVDIAGNSTTTVSGVDVDGAGVTIGKSDATGLTKVEDSTIDSTVSVAIAGADVSVSGENVTGAGEVAIGGSASTSVNGVDVDGGSLKIGTDTGTTTLGSLNQGGVETRTTLDASGDIEVRGTVVAVTDVAVESTAGGVSITGSDVSVSGKNVTGAGEVAIGGSASTSVNGVDVDGAGVTIGKSDATGLTKVEDSTIDSTDAVAIAGESVEVSGKNVTGAGEVAIGGSVSTKVSGVDVDGGSLKIGTDTGTTTLGSLNQGGVETYTTLDSSGDIEVRGTVVEVTDVAVESTAGGVSITGSDVSVSGENVTGAGIVDIAGNSTTSLRGVDVDGAGVAIGKSDATGQTKVEDSTIDSTDTVAVAGESVEVSGKNVTGAGAVDIAGNSTTTVSGVDVDGTGVSIGAADATGLTKVEDSTIDSTDTVAVAGESVEVSGKNVTGAGAVDIAGNSTTTVSGVDVDGTGVSIGAADATGLTKVEDSTIDSTVAVAIAGADVSMNGKNVTGTGTVDIAGNSTTAVNGVDVDGAGVTIGKSDATGQTKVEDSTIDSTDIVAIAGESVEVSGKNVTGAGEVAIGGNSTTMVSGVDVDGAGVTIGKSDATGLTKVEDSTIDSTGAVAIAGSDVSVSGENVTGAGTVDIAGNSTTTVRGVDVDGGSLKIGTDTGTTTLGSLNQGGVETYTTLDASGDIEVRGTVVEVTDVAMESTAGGVSITGSDVSVSGENVTGAGTVDIAGNSTTTVRGVDVDGGSLKIGTDTGTTTLGSLNQGGVETYTTLDASGDIEVRGTVVEVTDVAMESTAGGVSITGSDVSVSGENVTGAGAVDIAGNSTTTLRGVDVDGTGVTIGKSDATGLTKVEDSTIDSTDAVTITGESVEVSGKNVTGAGEVAIGGSASTSVNGVDVDGGSLKIGTDTGTTTLGSLNQGGVETYTTLDASGDIEVRGTVVEVTDVAVESTAGGVSITGSDVSVSGENVTGAGAVDIAGNSMSTVSGVDVDGAGVTIGKSDATGQTKVEDATIDSTVAVAIAGESVEVSGENVTGTGTVDIAGNSTTTVNGVDVDGTGVSIGAADATGLTKVEDSTIDSTNAVAIAGADVSVSGKNVTGAGEVAIGGSVSTSVNGVDVDGGSLKIGTDTGTTTLGSLNQGGVETYTTLDASGDIEVRGTVVEVTDVAVESTAGGVSITGSDVSVSGENVTGAGTVDIAGNSTTTVSGVDVDGAGVAIGKSDATGQTKVEDSTIDSTDAVAIAGESVEVSGENVTGAGTVDIAGNSTTTVRGVDVDGTGVSIGAADATGLTKVEDSTINSTDTVAIAGADVSVSGENVTGAGEVAIGGSASTSVNGVDVDGGSLKIGTDTGTTTLGSLNQGGGETRTTLDASGDIEVRGTVVEVTDVAMESTAGGVSITGSDVSVSGENVTGAGTVDIAGNSTTTVSGVDVDGTGVTIGKSDATGLTKVEDSTIDSTDAVTITGESVEVSGKNVTGAGIVDIAGNSTTTLRGVDVDGAGVTIGKSDATGLTKVEDSTIDFTDTVAIAGADVSVSGKNVTGAGIVDIAGNSTTTVSGVDVDGAGVTIGKSDATGLTKVEDSTIDSTDAVAIAGANVSVSGKNVIGAGTVDIAGNSTTTVNGVDVDGAGVTIGKSDATGQTKVEDSTIDSTNAVAIAGESVEVSGENVTGAGTVDIAGNNTTTVNGVDVDGTGVSIGAADATGQTKVEDSTIDSTDTVAIAGADVSVSGKNVTGAGIVDIAGNSTTTVNGVDVDGGSLKIGTDTGTTTLGSLNQGGVETYTTLDASGDIEVRGTVVEVTDVAVESTAGGVSITGSDVSVSGENVIGAGTVDIAGNSTTTLRGVDVDGTGVSIGAADATGLTKVEDSTIDSTNAVAIAGESVEVSGKNVTGAGAVDIAGNSTTTLRGVDVDGAGVVIGKSDATGQTKVEDATIDSTDTVAIAGESVEVSGENVTGAGTVDIAGNSTTTVRGVDVDGAGVTIGKSDATGLTRIEGATVQTRDYAHLYGKEVSVAMSTLTGTGEVSDVEIVAEAGTGLVEGSSIMTTGHIRMLSSVNQVAESVMEAGHAIELSGSNRVADSLLKSTGDAGCISIWGTEEDSATEVIDSVLEAQGDISIQGQTQNRELTSLARVVQTNGGLLRMYSAAGNITLNNVNLVNEAPVDHSYSITAAGQGGRIRVMERVDVQGAGLEADAIHIDEGNVLNVKTGGVLAGKLHGTGIINKTGGDVLLLEHDHSAFTGAVHVNGPSSGRAGDGSVTGRDGSWVQITDTRVDGGVAGVGLAAELRLSDTELVVTASRAGIGTVDTTADTGIHNGNGHTLQSDSSYTADDNSRRDFTRIGTVVEINRGHAGDEITSGGLRLSDATLLHLDSAVVDDGSVHTDHIRVESPAESERPGSVNMAAGVALNRVTPAGAPSTARVFINHADPQAVSAVQDGTRSRILSGKVDSAVNEDVLYAVTMAGGTYQRVLQSHNMHLETTADGVDLVYSRNYRSCAKDATTRGVAQVISARAAALNHTEGTLVASNDTFTRLVDAFDYTRSEAAAIRGLRSVAGADAGLLAPLSMVDASRNHLDTLRKHIAMPSCRRDDKFGLWTPNRGLWGSYTGGRNELGGSAEMSDYSRTFHGLLVGMDREINCKLRLGMSFGAERSTATSGSAELEGEALFLDAYAAMVTGAVKHRLTLGVGTAAFDASRQVRVDAGYHTFHGASTSSMDAASVNLGYEISTDCVLTPVSWVTRFASFNLAWVNVDDARDNGLGSAGVQVKYDDVLLAELAVGGRYTRQFHCIRYQEPALFTASAALHLELGDKRASATGCFAGNPAASWHMKSMERKPVYASFGVGLEVPFRTNWSATAGAEVEVGSSRTGGTGSIGVRYSF